MKTLLLLLLLLIGYTTVAQKKVHGFASFGTDADAGISFTKLQLEYAFKYKSVKIVPYTFQKAWFTPNADIFEGAKPFRHIYKLGVKFKYKKIFFNAYHYCSHIVITSYMEDEKNVRMTKGKKKALGFLDDMNIGKSNILEIGFKF